MKKNKYIIAVFSYLLGIIIYDAVPSSLYMYHTWVRVFFYLCQYGIILTLSCCLFNQVSDQINKSVLFGLMVFSSGMFIFHALLINKDLPTYIALCDSEKAAIIIDFGIIILSIVIWLFIAKKWRDEF